MSSVVAGVNIAIKIPRSQYEATLAFYREALGLVLRREEGQATVSHSAEFGQVRLWLDCVDGIGKADVWLEAVTDDVEGVAARAAAFGGAVRDEIEPLPEGMRAHWIADPCGNTILLTARDES